MSVNPQTLEVPHINALMASYVAARLHQIGKEEAWTQETRDWVINQHMQVAKGNPNPIPPWPPMAPPGVMSNLNMNLADPTRPDL